MGCKGIAKFPCHPYRFQESLAVGAQVVDMVHVVVCDQNCVDVIVGKTIFHQFLFEPAHADPGINDDSGPAFAVIHVQEVTVAATPAGQGLEYYFIADHPLYSI